MAIQYKIPFLLTLVVLFAVVLRVYHIDRESLWLDESTSYWWAKTSPVEIVTRVAGDTHTPLYYLTLHYWMKISGDSDWAIRLLSAIFGISAIPVVFQIGKLLFSQRFGLVAALFLVVSGFHIQYSQEARPYSLYFLLTSGSVLFTILAYKRIRYAWFGYIVSTALLLYTHNTALLAVIAIMLFYLILAWPWRLRAITSFLMATLVVLILYTPWIPVYLNQLTLVQGDMWWTSALTAKQVLKTLQKLALFPQRISFLGWIQYGLLCLPLCVLLLSLPSLWAKEKKTLIAMAFLFLIPVGINLIFSTTIRNIFLLRLLIPGLLVFPFLWATPMLMERVASYRNLAMIAMISMFLISLAGSIHFLLHNFKEPWRDLVEIFQENYKPGDEVVYLMAYNKKPFVRYLPPNFYDLPVVVIEEDKIDSAVLGAPKMTSGRLWLVRRYGGIKSRDKALIHKTVASLDAKYKKLSEWKLKNLEMVLYEPL